jgi:hypothetical protein
MIYRSAIVLMLCLLSFPGKGQEYYGPPNVQDCLGAIPVCQPIYTTTASYTGHGNVYPEIHANSLCPLCMDGEKNDVFYIITVQTAGILRFTLTPNNAANDYDWSLFNMTNAGCDQLYPQATSLQVSCNSWGVPGTNGPTGISTALGNNLNCNGPGTVGVKFNKDLTVQAGQTFLLNVSNWSSSNQSGYTLDFSGSTASIFDVTPAVIDSLQQNVSCAGSDSIFLRFSENVKCADLFHHPEKLNLNGPAGSYTITGVNSMDCGTGATNGRRFILLVSPKAEAGNYTLSINGIIRDLCDNVCEFNDYAFTMSEINAPIATAGNDTTVSNGSVITLKGNGAGGAPPYSFHWEPAQYVVNPNIAQPLTTNLGGSVNFTLSMTDQAGCHGTDDVMVTVTGGPLGAMASASPAVICHGETTVLSALVSGGSGNYTYTWSSIPAGFSSNLPSPTVTPTLSTTYHLQVSDGFNTVSGSATVTVHPKPLADAGTPASIPYGTNTTLQGSAAGGSGSYTYSWTSLPPGFSSAQQNPLVTNLQQSAVFRLVATDTQTGCVSEPSEVTVTVTGSPLQCTPVATPPSICKGSTTQLRAMPGGGSGNYSYTWSSTPPGFTSTVENPSVSPQETTIYRVTLSDGFNTYEGQTVVIVRPVPVFPGWSEDTVMCLYETLILDAGNPGSIWIWSNGATSQTIPVQTTGIGFDNQLYSVKVVNEQGCIDSARVSIIFTADACTGIGESSRDDDFRIYPNPVKNELLIRTGGSVRPTTCTILNPLGVPLVSDRLSDSGNPSEPVRYQVSGWPSGLYFVKIGTQNKVYILKFIKR